MPEAQEVVIKSLSPLVRGTRSIFFDTYFPYKPGQALQVKFPGDAKARYFSLSSSPTENGSLAITVKADHGAPLAEAMNALIPGVSAVEVSGPWGSFTLPDHPENALCFLAGGTGVAPFRSMIKFLMDRQSPLPLLLFHSARSSGDLLFNADFTKWAETGKNFRYIPIVTGHEPDWKNARERISLSLLQQHLPPPPVTFFLCGPTGFVGDLEAVLTESLHVPVDHIRREQW